MTQDISSCYPRRLGDLAAAQRVLDGILDRISGSSPHMQELLGFQRECRSLAASLASVAEELPRAALLPADKACPWAVSLLQDCHSGSKQPHSQWCP
jgi:hypothetical protein